MSNSFIITATAISNNQSFNEVILRLQDKADPIGTIMIILGFAVVMLGQKQKGLEIIKWTAIGYLGIQFGPMIMSWIKDIARAGMIQ